MRKTRLFIKKNNKWEELDLFDDIVIPITLKVFDIKTFGQKNSSFSSDFDIPHTNHNAVVFGLVDDLNTYNATFEYGKNYDAYLEMDGLQIFTGQFRLKKIFKKRGGAYTVYQGCLFSESKNFVDSLGIETLVGNEDSTRDLDFTEYDTPAEEMTLADFVSKLQTFDTGGYGWGLTLIDKTNKASQPFSSGAQSWYTDECTPYLFVVEIFNKIFTKSGYKYESEFISNSSYCTDNPQWTNTIGKFNFYNLIYPYMQNNSKMKQKDPVSSEITKFDTTTDAVIARSEFYNQSSLEESELLTWTPLFDDDWILTESNVDSSLNAYQFTAPVNGSYNVKWKFNLEARIALRYTWNDSSPADVTWEFHTKGRKQYTVYVGVEKNGRIIGTPLVEQDIVEGDKYVYLEYSDYTQRTEGWITLKTGTMTYENKSMWLNAGDTLKLYMWVEVPVKYYVYDASYQDFIANYVFYRTMGSGETQIIRNYYPKYTEIKISNIQNPVISNVLNDGFFEGNPFYPNLILNQRTTKIDFFNTLVKMFNLYVEDVSGKKNYKTGKLYPPKTLRIEPFEIYYHPDMQYGSNVHDWTEKIDWDSIEYRRIDDYLYNVQRFSYTDNKDFYLNNYNNTYLIPYGQRDVRGIYCTDATNINNVNLQNGVPVCGKVNNLTETLFCPKAFSLNNNNGLDINKEYKDSFLFIWNNNMLGHTETNYTLKVQSRIYPNSSTNITSYYCTDVLNEGYSNDTANLLFKAPPQAYYQNTGNVTQNKNDLFNAFYNRQYTLYTETDARIMRCNAYLTTFDIATLQLSDTIIVDQNRWHVLKINQWKTEKTPCEIELIKILPEETFIDYPPIKDKKLEDDVLPLPNN